jgi:hypothetical protein
MRKSFLYESSNPIGVISINELQKAFPHLAIEYRNIFGSKRPDIKVISTDSFSGSGGGEGIKEIAVFYKNGQTKSIEGSWGGSNPWASAPSNALDQSSTISLHNDEAVMACTIGAYFSCRLYLHPSLVNPTLLGSAEGETDLDLFEIAVLVAFVSLIPAARKKEFFDFASGDWGAYNLERPFRTKPTKEQKKQLFKDKYLPMGVKTYQELYDKVIQNLASKNLVKVSSNGAAQLTMTGKNKVVGLKNL